MAARPPVDRFRLVGKTLKDTFRVEAVVSEGGFGVVYRGTHLLLERPVAVKVLKVPMNLRSDQAAHVVDSFVREARIVAKISHANIVQVIDFGVHAEDPSAPAPWMALEWLEGMTLRDEIRSRGGDRWTPQESMTLLDPVLDALSLIHGERIAHRDLKPTNFMLVQTRQGRVLKMLDFGIAKVMEEGEEPVSGETQTRSPMAAFSLKYAAPEQIGGTRTGPWTDVHAMALMFTEMLTGRPPFTSRDGTDLAAEVLAAVRPTPRAFGWDVGAWEAVLGRALSLRAAERYPDARTFREALRAALPGARAAEPLSHDATTAIALGPRRAAPATSDAEPQTTMRSSVSNTPVGAARAFPRRGWLVGAVAGIAVVGVATVGALRMSRSTSSRSHAARAIEPVPVPARPSLAATAPPAVVPVAAVVVPTVPAATVVAPVEVPLQAAVARASPARAVVASSAPHAPIARRVPSASAAASVAPVVRPAEPRPGANGTRPTGMETIEIH